VGLEEQLDVRAGELSGGERRRLELARALTRPPRVLVCDEPFAGVDPVGAEQLGICCAIWPSNRATVLLADHHVTEALRVCTRALLLLDGTVAVSAPVAEFRGAPAGEGALPGAARWDADGRKRSTVTRLSANSTAGTKLADPAASLAAGCYFL
jgi:lipopolysaccharide export system ATP-binding protein